MCFFYEKSIAIVRFGSLQTSSEEWIWSHERHSKVRKCKLPMQIGSLPSCFSLFTFFCTEPGGWVVGWVGGWVCVRSCRFELSGAMQWALLQPIFKLTRLSRSKSEKLIVFQLHGVTLLGWESLKDLLLATNWKCTIFFESLGWSPWRACGS